MEQPTQQLPFFFKKQVLLNILSLAETPADTLQLYSSLRQASRQFTILLHPSDIVSILFHRFCFFEAQIADSLNGDSSTRFGRIEEWQNEANYIAHCFWPQLRSEENRSMESMNHTNEIAKPHIQLESRHPLPPNPQAKNRARYCEISLQSITSFLSNPVFRIGLSLSSPYNRRDVGCYYGSFGFDVLKNLVFTSNSFGIPVTSTWNNQKTQCVGIGICHECHSDELGVDCFFITRNGNLIASFRCIPTETRNFLHLQIHSENISTSFSVNYGLDKFVFDLESWVRGHAPKDSVYQSYLPSYEDAITASCNKVNDFWNVRISEAGKGVHYTHPRQLYDPVDPSIVRFAEQHSEISNLNLIIDDLLAEEWDESQSKPSPLNRLQNLIDWQRFADRHDLSLELSSSQLLTLEVFISIKRQILIQLVRKMHAKRVKLITSEVVLLRNRPSIHDDADSARGGVSEGWAKLVMFFESYEPADESWMDVVRDQVLDQIIRGEIDMANSCPGFLLEGICGVNTDENVVIDDIYGETEEEKANEMIKITTSYLAWACWYPGFIGSIHIKIKPNPSNSNPLEEDHTLMALSYSLIASHSQDPTRNLLSDQWILMQYLSWGYAKGSPINDIPRTRKQAIDHCSTYFLSSLSLSDIRTISEEIKLLEESIRIPQEMEYLLNVYALARQIEVQDRSQLKFLALDVVSIIRRFALRAIDPSIHPPADSAGSNNSAPLFRSFGDLTTHSSHISMPTWLLLGIGIGIGCMFGIVAARVVSRK